MKVRLGDLPADRVELLKRIARERGWGEGTLFLAEPHRWLAVVGLLCLGIGLASAWCLRSGALEWSRPADAALPWIGLLGLAYGPLALLEYGRILRAELKPFLLLTPFNLVRCRGSHRPLDLYRLPEARAFQRVEEYHGVKWTGQAYTFNFEEGKPIKFVLRQAKDIEVAERTLALARAAGRGEPLPDLPIRRAGDLGPGFSRPEPRPGGLEKVFDPASETWLVVLGFLCLAFIPYAIFR
ncbi:MAG: hypothetical protein P4L11_04250 [Geothrix sp.]|nr:hypothetical protein [Geothrix sp.]